MQLNLFGVFAATEAGDVMVGSLGVSNEYEIIAAGVLLLLVLILLGLLSRRLPLISRNSAQRVGTKAEAPSGRLAKYNSPIAQTSVRRRADDRGRLPIAIGSSVCLVFFGGLGIWAALVEVESAAVARAIVKVETNRLTIDHPDGGTIAELLVRDGDNVDAGQLLVRLDTADLESQLSILERRRDSLLTLRARLVAEQASATAVSYPDELLIRARQDAQLAETVATQSSLFHASNDALKSEVEVREQRIRQMDQRIEGIEAQLRSIQKQLTLISSERIDVEGLFEKGLTPQTRVLALKREEARLEGQIGALQAEAAQARAAIGETRLAIIQSRRNKLAKTADELRVAVGELIEVIPRIDNVRTKIARAKLRAPAAGTVFGLTKFTSGGVISPAESVLQIVPDAADLIIEARINPVDRDVVSSGMVARVRMIAFSFQTVAPIKGMLKRVSADATIDPDTRERYYTAIVELGAEDLERSDILLQPGMPAEVIIPLNARTPIAFLLEPLVRSWDRALRES